MADNAITLQGLSAITRFIGRSTFQTQDQHLVLGRFLITTNHPLKSWAVWVFPGTSLEKEPPRVCLLERDECSINQRFVVPNGRHHFRGGVIHHSVCAHLCLRLAAGSEICRQLSRERELLDPMVWSVLHLHAEPVGFPWGIHQTKGWTLVDSHRTPRRTTRFFDVLTARVFQEKKP